MTNTAEQSKSDLFIDSLKGKISAVLTDLRAEGRMLPITEHADYRFEFVKNWNDFVDKGLDGIETWQSRSLCDDISRMFAKEMLSAEYRLIRADPELEKDDEKRVVEMGKAFETLAKTGNMQNAFNGIHAHSPVFKGRVMLTFEDWRPKFNYWNTETTKYEPLPRIDVRPITHMEIDLPTGELLICDWFRIEEFTTILKSHDGFNICYAEDRIKRTIDGVKNYKLMEVAVGSTNPAIVPTADDTGKGISQLRIGHIEYHEDTDDQINPGLNIAGNVSTQYWAATLIDRADLLSLLETVMTKQEALDKIKFLIEEHPYDKPNVVQLSPGKWHFYFVEDRVNNIHQLEHATDALGAGLETMLMLSKTPLDIPDDLVLHA